MNIIYINKKTAFAVLLLLVGLVLLLPNVKRTYQYNHCQNINEASSIKLGDIYRCEIDECVYKTIGNIQKLSCAHYGMFGKEYDMFTIPYGNERYIRICAYSEGKAKDLFKFVNGRGDKFDFYATGIASFTDNKEFYEDIEGFDYNKVEKDIVLLEIDNFSFKNKTLLGMYMILCSILLLIWAAKDKC